MNANKIRYKILMCDEKRASRSAKKTLCEYKIKYITYSTSLTLRNSTFVKTKYSVKIIL